MTALCKGCGAEFAPRRSNNTWCTNACLQRHKHRDRRERIAAGVTEPSHGYGGYSHGCRCDVCREAKADYVRERRALGRASAQQNTKTSSGRRGSRGNAWGPGSYRYIAPGIVHGSRAGYDEHGCRCEDCTQARTASDRRYRRAS